jgi:hypothetical protein
MISADQPELSPDPPMGGVLRGFCWAGGARLGGRGGSADRCSSGMFHVAGVVATITGAVVAVITVAAAANRPRTPEQAKPAPCLA